MLADLAAAYPGIKDCFDEASEGAETDLWALAQSGPEAQLNQTEYTQPALLAASVALWRTWCAARGPAPARMAGHSLGEYSALVCAGVLLLREAAGLVRARGRLMQEAVPQGVGAMAAVLGAEDELVARVCQEQSGAEVVSPANFNCPGQVVIAGHATAVARVLAALAEQGIKKAIPLPVSVPSHTPLMQQAAQALGARMQGIGWQVPRVPVLQNVDGRCYSSVAEIQRALVAQLHQPVRWTACVQNMARAGTTQVFECGPGKVLSGLCKRIDKTLDCHPLGTQADFASALAREFA